MADDFARCVDFMRANVTNRAERIVRTEHGTACFTDDLPRVWYLNFLLVDLGASATVDELIAEADAVQGAAGLAHRQISIDHKLGAAVADDFRRLDWRIEEELLMAHNGSTPQLDLSTVEEVTADALVPVWTAGMWTHPEVDEETVRQLVDAQLRRQRAVQVRYFAARVGGEVASYCELFSDGCTGQIESVMTEERFRGRGLGKTVVAGALAASQRAHDFTFIVADARDWPKELYRKLGFEAVGNTYTFVRRPRDC
jgi:predicted GNAT family N-acyltransferase